MGRYLSCAVATSMVVKKKNDKHFEKEELNKLKESVRRIFDLNLYNIEEGDNYLFFDIKKDIFNAHIHELCRELNKSFFLLQFALYNDEYLDENRPNEEWPIILTETKEGNNYMLDLGKNSYGNNTESKLLSLFGFAPLLRREFPNWRDYDFTIQGTTLFIDIDKVIFEDETEFVCLLNWFKKDYFKNKLSSSIVFHITD